jgi:hypothetical protein
MEQYNSKTELNKLINLYNKAREQRQQLPDDVIYNILLDLNINDYGRLAQTNERFYNILKHSDFWIKKYNHDKLIYLPSFVEEGIDLEDHVYYYKHALDDNTKAKHIIYIYDVEFYNNENKFINFEIRDISTIIFYLGKNYKKLAESIDYDFNQDKYTITIKKNENKYIFNMKGNNNNESIQLTRNEIIELLSVILYGEVHIHDNFGSSYEYIHNSSRSGIIQAYNYNYKI